MHRNKFLFNEANRRTNFPNLFLSRISTCFGQFLCPSSGVFHCTFVTGICHAGFDDSFKARPSWSCLKAVIKPAWHMPVTNVQWKTPGDGQRNCPKHVECLDKNTFGKLVHPLILLKRVILGSSIFLFQYSFLTCWSYVHTNSYKFGHIIDNFTFQWDDWICCACAKENFPIWHYRTDRIRQINALYKTQQVHFLLCIDIRHILTLRRHRFSPRVVHIRTAYGILCLCLREVSQSSILHRVWTLGAQPEFDWNELWWGIVVAMQICGARFEVLTAVLLRTLRQDASALRRVVPRALAG